MGVDGQMTREEAIAYFKDMNECTYGDVEPIQMAIKALEQASCEDAINRKTIKAIPLEKFKEMDKEVRNYFATTFYPSLSGVLMILHKHVELIDSPTREHGEWIEHKYAEEVDGCMISNYECSLCHSWKREATDFCPCCGADMRGKQK